MKPTPIPSKELIESILDYDRETGKFFWKKRSPDQMRCPQEVNRWNKRFAGKEAGSIMHKREFNLSYRYIRVYEKTYSAARLAACVIGYSQEEIDNNQVDHIDGNGLNNRPDNIRMVTPRENARNRKKRKDNTSGYTGVIFHKRSGMWAAQITVGETSKCLGYFRDPGEAAKRVKDLRKTGGYTSRHGI